MTKAVTDFVSVRGDLIGSFGTVFLVAFDTNGVQIGFDTEVDSGGALLSISAAGIHMVSIFSDTGTVAFDDLTFNPVEIPEPNTYIFVGAGLGLAVLGRRLGFRAF